MENRIKTLESLKELVSASEQQNRHETVLILENDDESDLELSEEAKTALAEAEEDVRNGRLISLEKNRAEFGLRLRRI